MSVSAKPPKKPQHNKTHLVVGRSEAPPDILVIQHLNLKAEVLLEVFNDHDQEGQLDTQRLGRVSWTRDVGCAHVAAHDFQNTGLDVTISDTLDMSVTYYNRLNIQTQKVDTDAASEATLPGAACC